MNSLTRLTNLARPITYFTNKLATLTPFASFNGRRGFTNSVSRVKDASHEAAGTAIDAGEDSSQTAQLAKRAGSSSGLKGLRSKAKRYSLNGPQDGSRMILGQSCDLPIRARFAPSPTGFMHLGSLRTALFNKLAVTASKNGSFILRIEDTDQTRLVPLAKERLMEDLEWAGLTWDEGPTKGGAYGPYIQSERLPLYKEHVGHLLAKGNAYRCFCTSRQLEEQKLALHEAGKPTVYPGTCRSIDKPESDARAENGEAHVIRFKSDPDHKPSFRDAIYGPFQKKDAEEDFVLMKTDGFPTYHFANVVDDHLMKITHVIRGEEWLISTPKHIALYQAFGWEPPTFAHLGLLVHPDGTKLSKRHGNTELSSYRQDNIFPVALANWLANLGSSFHRGIAAPRTIKDIANALTFKFTKGGIKLNAKKLQNFNDTYLDTILSKPLPELAEHEMKEIQSTLIEPVLREIAIRNVVGYPAQSADPNHSHGPADGASSEAPELVDAMVDAGRRSGYVLDILRARKGGVQTAKAFVEQHRYLFWRVPARIYMESISKDPNFSTREGIHTALDEIIVREDEWAGDEPNAMRALMVKLEANGDENKMLALHNELRFIAIGSYEGSSLASKKLLQILGPQEWKRRLDRLRHALAR